MTPTDIESIIPAILIGMIVVFLSILLIPPIWRKLANRNGPMVGRNKKFEVSFFSSHNHQNDYEKVPGAIMRAEEDFLIGAKEGEGIFLVWEGVPGQRIEKMIMEHRDGEQRWYPSDYSWGMPHPPHNPEAKDGELCWPQPTLSYYESRYKPVRSLSTARIMRMILD